MKVTIWIPAYRPFILGGDVNAPVSAEVDGSSIDLGRGFKGYLVKTPAGGTVVAEAKSGGIVGQSLDQVLIDVREANLSVMRKQVREAVETSKRATKLPPDQFWKHVKGATKNHVART
jgi:hypothetical protein